MLIRSLKDIPKPNQKLVSAIYFAVLAVVLGQAIELFTFSEGNGLVYLLVVGGLWSLIFAVICWLANWGDIRQTSTEHGAIEP